MIGYKATDMNGRCRGFKFEVGKTYTKDTPKEKLECCTNKVFHYCREISAIEVESYYKLSESRLFEVIAGDYVRSGDKYGTNSLTILREIVGDEKQDLINSGSRNSGSRNSGDSNSGDFNSGDSNSGGFNSGDFNSGDFNSGDFNSGDFNSGDFNSGNRNSGNRNSGGFNSGDFNSGDFNSGDSNSGNRNSGSRNSGDFNSGDFNSGDFNSGGFNSGDFNSGDSNSGSRNSGDFNSGDFNSGGFNSGDFNSGSRNSGSRNSGNRNNGGFNSGDFNSGSRNSGFFNSDEPNVRMFNKDTKFKYTDIHIPSWCFFDLTLWVSYDTATEQEKEIHKQEIKASGGFLKTLNYMEAWRLAWDKASKKEHKELLTLPNWDNDIFKEITGIDAEAEMLND